MTKQEILNASRELSEDDLRDVVQQLLMDMSLDLDVLKAGSLKQLVLERAAQLDANPSSGIPAREAIAELRAKYLPNE